MPCPRVPLSLLEKLSSQLVGESTLSILDSTSEGCLCVREGAWCDVEEEEEMALFLGAVMVSTPSL